jgi:hypothetical protein
MPGPVPELSTYSREFSILHLAFELFRYRSDFRDRASAGMGSPRAEQAMRIPSRFSRVSSRLALITQYALVRLYQGAWP